MLPRQIVNDDLISDFEEVIEPSLTYNLDFTRKRISGLIDGRQAIEQAIYKTLDTERYAYVIYSWYYASELNKLIGQPIPFVYSEIKRYITEALAQDDRIQSVDAFYFERNRNKVSVSFTAHTIAGVIDITKEVSI